LATIYLANRIIFVTVTQLPILLFFLDRYKLDSQYWLFNNMYKKLQ